MYSRFSGQSNMPEKSFQIPEHYSGCVFSQGVKVPDSPRQEKQPTPAFFEVAKPTPPPEKTEPDAEPGVPTQKPTTHAESVEAAVKHLERPHPSAASPFSSLFGSLGSAFPFSHGLGFEELLILGLIIMLSRNENESDIVLLLGLLLFCG